MIWDSDSNEIDPQGKGYEGVSWIQLVQ